MGKTIEEFESNYAKKSNMTLEEMHKYQHAEEVDECELYNEPHWEMVRNNIEHYERRN